MKTKTRRSYDGSKVRTTLYLPAVLRTQAKIYAARHQTTVTNLLIEGLKLRLKQHPQQEQEQ